MQYTGNLSTKDAISHLPRVEQQQQPILQNHLHPRLVSELD